MRAAEVVSDSSSCTSSSSDEDDTVRAPPEYRTRMFDEDLLPTVYKQQHRVSVAVVDYLERKLGEVLRYKTTRNQALSPRHQILLFLHFLGTNSFYHVLRDARGPSHMTVCRVVHRVAQALVQLKDKVIGWPHDTSKICRKFYEIARFPSVCGCIDGTHVQVQPLRDVEADFVNRHHTHSLNVLAVAGPDLRFYHVNSTYPGSCHDSGVLRKTTLWTAFESGSFKPFEGAVILGDSAYPIRQWLMTPFRGDPAGQKAKFNRAHTKTRNTVERAFGALKARFQALKSGLRVRNMERASQLIVCAAIIHNLCILLGDDVEDMAEDVQPEDQQHHHHHDAEEVVQNPPPDERSANALGERRRQAIMESLH